MLSQKLLSILSAGLNRYLHLDAASSERLAPLKGHALTIALEPFEKSYQLVFNAEGVELHTGENSPASASIRGTPLGFIQILLTRNQRQQFFAKDLVLTGNAELAQQALALFEEAEIDWEEQLARLTGDVPAHTLSHTAQRLRQRLRKASRHLTQDIHDYLHEEKEWLPPRPALLSFLAEVDELRMHVDRIEARIHLLEENLK